jgi:hypothetical protein
VETLADKPMFREALQRVQGPADLDGHSHP